MLVYANKMCFQPDEGYMSVVKTLARWISFKTKSVVDPEFLSQGIMQLRFRDGSSLTARATLNEDGTPGFPYLFCARYVHGQPDVSGRRWRTEIGIRQDYDGATVDCSILLQTDDVSTRVSAPVEASRPKIVEMLAEQCSPVGQTPGIHTTYLDADTLKAFPYEVDRKDRQYPIVVVSATKSGEYFVNVEYLRSLLVGLARIVVIPSALEPYKVLSSLDGRYAPFGGEIKVLYPPRKGGHDQFIESVRITREQMGALRDEGKGVEHELLAAITHRTNLPYSWEHISIDTVSQAIFRKKLTKALTQVNDGELTERSRIYEDLLSEAGEAVNYKERQIEALKSDLQSQGEDIRALKAKIDALNYHLSGQRPNEDVPSDEAVGFVSALRDSVLAAIDERLGLERAIQLISSLYPDRIVVLESAMNSARESDKGGFQHGAKAFSMLRRLATGYWEALADGKGDQHAKTVFGRNEFAAAEASKLSSPGRAARTFIYKGNSIYMEKHLKHGIKDSAAETLRIHFDWFASEKRLVIGHCGKHLDF